MSSPKNIVCEFPHELSNKVRLIALVVIISYCYCFYYYLFKITQQVKNICHTKKGPLTPGKKSYINKLADKN